MSIPLWMMMIICGFAFVGFLAVALLILFLIQEYQMRKAEKPQRWAIKRWKEINQKIMERENERKNIEKEN